MIAQTLISITGHQYFVIRTCSKRITIAHRIADTRLLGQMFLGVFSIASTVIPMLFLLEPKEASACQLTNEDADAFHALGQALNATCTWNITITPSGVTTL